METFYFVASNKLSPRDPDQIFTRFKAASNAHVYCRALCEEFGVDDLRVYQYIPASVVELDDPRKSPTYDRT